MQPQIVSVWILGDQLLLPHPALETAEKDYVRENIRVVLIESSSRLTKLHYQKKKLVLLLSAMRHYAEKLRSAGYVVEYVQASDFLAGLQQHIATAHVQQLFTMAASEYDMRMMQQSQLEEHLKIPVTLLPNTQFLVEQYNPVPHPQAGKRYVMENFYRNMRRHFAILLEGDGKPAGGQWNYDKQNRASLPQKVAEPPQAPAFEPDTITQAVIAQVESLERGIGSAHGFDLAVTHEQAQESLQTFIRERLPLFGLYEDAMSSDSGVLYHSQLSPYINIGLLDPMDMLQEAEVAYLSGTAPLNAVEGFIRQILGWREYMYWQYWQQMPELRSDNAWHSTRQMPLMFWDGQTEMNCIKHVAGRVLETGYNHHIERLMIVCNFCLLAGIIPSSVAEWFLSCYFDAYDWVVLPNVIGMGMNADDGYTATKPYISSANYINKMSNYCQGCRYSPQKRVGPDACPYNFLYWNFLSINEQKLRANPRFGPNVLSLRHIGMQERRVIEQEAERFLEELIEYAG